MSETKELFRLIGLALIVLIGVWVLMMTIMLLTMGGVMTGGGISSAVFLFQLLVVGVLGVAGFKLWRMGTTEEADSTPAHSGPIADLQQAYIDGELTEAEFEAEMENLLDSGEEMPDANIGNKDHLDDFERR